MADPTDESKNYDWSRFELRIDVKCNIEDAYQAWATKQGLEKWFLRKANFTNSGLAVGPADYVHKGDEYEWYWFGWSDEMVEKGTILEANGKDLLRFVFGNAGEVSIRIFPEKDIMIVELRQEKIPLENNGQVNFHLGCSKGWVFYLANLKSILEGGIDLRNKNDQLKNVINS